MSSLNLRAALLSVLIFLALLGIWHLATTGGTAAGRTTWKALRSGRTSSVLATLSQSRRTEATPNAVLTSIGQTEQMKITKIAEREESLMV